MGGSTLGTSPLPLHERDTPSLLSLAGQLAAVFAVAGFALCLTIIGFGAGLLLLGISTILGLATVVGHHALRWAHVPNSSPTHPWADQSLLNSSRPLQHHE